jgi:hypothetical protein
VAPYRRPLKEPFGVPKKIAKWCQDFPYKGLISDIWNVRLGSKAGICSAQSYVH